MENKSEQSTAEFIIMSPEDFSKETKKISNDLKRIRGENWSEEDKELLKDLVKKRVKEVENKNTDTNTNNAKKKAWLDIAKDFNSLSSYKNRSVAQLRSQWSSIKMQAKKEVAEFRMKAKQTGGGEAPTETALSGNDLAVWLPNEFVIDTNQYDSDGHLMTKEICYSVLDSEEEKKKNEVEFENNGCTPYKKKVKKSSADKINNTADENILKIATADVECRKELHLLQVEAEKKRIRNLDLEFELIQARLSFYKKKSLDNIEI